MKKFVISLVFLSLCLKYGWSALHRDDKIEGWLNGKKLLEATDMTFIEAGGVGVWTKADAADLVRRSYSKVGSQQDNNSS